MNIFVLDQDISKAAQYACDQHVVKMCTETAQILCTVHHISGTAPEQIPYRSTHARHPCVLWAAENHSNYLWLVEYGLELAKEYTYRYDKIIKSQQVIEWAEEHKPKINKGKLTPHPKCMPEELRLDDVVSSYRNFYNIEKIKFARYARGRNRPYWMENNNG